jgi:co-chaperonin GroES (HSP10)
MINPIQGKLVPIRNHILASDMYFGEQKTQTGIVLLNDDGKTEGIKPRWCKVWAVGPEQTDVEVGDWILVEHGRWTRGITLVDESGEELEIRRIDAKGVILKSDEPPRGVQLGALSSPTAGSSFTMSDFTDLQRAF